MQGETYRGYTERLGDKTQTESKNKKSTKNTGAQGAVHKYFRRPAAPQPNTG